MADMRLLVTSKNDKYEEDTIAFIRDIHFY